MPKLERAASSLRYGGSNRPLTRRRYCVACIRTYRAERVVTWASGNTAVATVSSAGLVTGVAVGQATITATSEAKSAAAAIEVVLPGPIPDINGVWDWTEHIADEANRGVCDDTGSYT